MARGDSIVLLHGLGRTRQSFKLAEIRLRRLGFDVVNIGYPSRRRPIAELADRVGAEVRDRCTDPDRPIHFVTHSLGGIVLRYFLEHDELENLGRVVMLSPPSRGSELAESLKDNPVYRLATGPSGQQLGTGPESVPTALAPPEFELGIITGNRALVRVFSRRLDGPNDGIVSVDGTKVEGMTDFLVVPHGHTFIMNSREVLRQIVRFIETGRFDRPEEAPVGLAPDATQNDGAPRGPRATRIGS